MNTERFIANRIIFGSGSNNQLSRPITKIAVLGIALGLGVMILTVGIVEGFQSEIRNKLIGLGSHIRVTNYDANLSDEPQPIDRSQVFMEELKKDPAFLSVQVFATKNGIIKTDIVNEGALLKGVGADHDWTFIKENLKEGRVFQVSDTGLSKDIVISTYLANKLQLKLNDKMKVFFLSKKEDSTGLIQYEQRAKAFYICGIYETGFEDIDKELVLVDLAQIQKLNYWNKDQVGGFEIAIKDYKKIDELGLKVDEMIGQGLVAQTIKEVNPTVFSWLELQDVNAVIVIVMMLIVAVINIISALLILILERTNMIGTLKALGATNGSIRKIFIYNAAYLIGKGILWGNILGIGLAVFQQQTGFFKLDQAQYYVSVIPVQIHVIDILSLNAGTMLCCLVMLILPSYIVSRITPVKAIRFS